jgi:hypothetical protein
MDSLGGGGGLRASGAGPGPPPPRARGGGDIKVKGREGEGVSECVVSTNRSPYGTNSFHPLVFVLLAPGGFRVYHSDGSYTRSL